MKKLSQLKNVKAGVARYERGTSAKSQALKSSPPPSPSALKDLSSVPSATPCSEELKQKYAPSGPPAPWVPERAARVRDRHAPAEAPSQPQPALPVKAPPSIVEAQVEELILKYQLCRGQAVKIVRGMDSIEACLARREQRAVQKARHEAGMKLAVETGVSIGVALNILAGLYTLESWRNRHEARIEAEGAARDYLILRQAGGNEIVLHRYGQQIKGTVASLLTYDIKLHTASGTRRYRKLKTLYLYEAKDAEAIATSRRVATDVQQLGLGPQRHASDRYQVPEEIVCEALAHNRGIRLTFNDGSIFEGHLIWRERYNMLLRLESGVELLVYNHGLYDLSLAHEAEA